MPVVSAVADKGHRLLVSTEEPNTPKLRENAGRKEQ
jgi:hypothetical protein